MVFSIFKQSLGIAVNRNILQIASIFITALLGLSNELVLTQFSLALSYAAIFFIVVSFIQLGVQPELSQFYAQKNYKALLRLFDVTLAFILCLSVLLVFKLWISSNPFSESDASLKLEAFNALRILATSLPFVGLLTTITYFLESIGESNKVTKLRIVQFFLQVSFVSLTLWVKPEQYNWINASAVCWVAGTYVLSDILMFIAGLALFFSKKISFKDHSLIKNDQLMTNEIKKIIKFGLPVMLGIVGQKTIFYICTSYCSTLGIWQTFAFTVMNSIVLLLQIPLMGLSNLLTIKISFLRGEKKFFELKELTKKYINLYVAEGLIIALVLFFFYSQIIKLFTTDNAILLNMFMLKPYIILFFVMNLMLTFNMGALRGFSDNFIPQIIILSALTCGVLPWVVLPLDINLSQLIIFFVVSGFAASIILTVRLKNNIKQTLIR